MTIQPQPFFGDQPATTKKPLPVKANSAFYLTHHPVAWELVIEGKKVHWLPELSKLHVIPGVCGVQGLQGGGADSALAKARAIQQGKRVLPWSLGYLTKYPARGGEYFCVKWSKPKSIGRNIVNKLDAVGWNEFRRKLIVDGYVEPMDEDLVPIKIQELETSLNRLFKDQHIPEIKKKMQAIQQKIEAMKKGSILQAS